jgi:hypothetical protein
MCDQANWPTNTADIENVLQNAGTAGKLVKIAAGGSTVAEIPVTIVSYDNGQIVVSPTQTAIAKGWSGSGLYVGARLVGILMNVDTSSGRGAVKRIDYVERILSDFVHPCCQISDPFIRELRSPDFDQRMHSLFAMFVSNTLETLRGDHVHSVDEQGPEDSSGTRTFRSTLQLPAFNQPGTLAFQNTSGYYQPPHLEKHPSNLTYIQTFRDEVPGKDLLKARFDALAAAVDIIVPSSWTRNAYSDGYSRGEPYKYRNEYASDGLRILISLNSFDLEVKFLPKQ